MPSRAEMLGDGTICRQKALGMTGGFEPLHATLALTRRSMGVLTPVVEIAALPMFHPGQDLALRSTVALQFIRPKYSEATVRGNIVSICCFIDIFLLFLHEMWRILRRYGTTLSDDNFAENER